MLFFLVSCIKRFFFFSVISFGLVRQTARRKTIMSDPTTAEEAAAKAALDSAQSSFFLSSKLIFLLALMVPVALLGNPHLDKTCIHHRLLQWEIQQIKPENAYRFSRGLYMACIRRVTKCHSIFLAIQDQVYTI